MPNGKRAIRSRLDFSKIPTATQIPNLIEVQRRSYERFLQMDKLPKERDDSGLQSVFVSVFPIADFRGISQLDFVDYSIGNWECKCGHLKGLHHLRTACVNIHNGADADPSFRILWPQRPERCCPSSEAKCFLTCRQPLRHWIGTRTARLCIGSGRRSAGASLGRGLR